MVDTASRVIDLVRVSQRPYAVFVHRSVEMMPADGDRFAKLQRDPARMAFCVGVFEPSAQVADVAAAIGGGELAGAL